MEKESIYQMKLGKIYPLLVQKAVRKGRTQAEVDTVICWLTGYSREELCALAQGAISYGDFFRQAPHLNERREEIRGGVCGVPNAVRPGERKSWNYHVSPPVSLRLTAPSPEGA